MEHTQLEQTAEEPPPTLQTVAEAVVMASLCYPYGSGITCVCDEGRIYKCFPDLKSESGGGGGGGLQGGTRHNQPQQGDLHTSALEDLTGLDRR